MSGRAVRLTPLAPGDTATVRRVFEGLSQRSRASRFLTAMPRLPASLLRVLAATDGRSHVAMVASIDGEPVGIGRYICVGRGAAEVAGSVVDAFADEGVGSRLFAGLVHHARSHAVDSFVATVSAENARVLAALRRRGAQLSLVDRLVEARLELRGLESDELESGAPLVHARRLSARGATRRDLESTRLVR